MKDSDVKLYIGHNALVDNILELMGARGMSWSCLSRHIGSGRWRPQARSQPTCSALDLLQSHSSHHRHVADDGLMYAFVCRGFYECLARSPPRSILG